MSEVAITPAVRIAVFKAWDNRCAYCRAAPAEHIDHIFPKSKGGSDALANFAPACRPCNLRKYDLELAEGFLQIMLAQATAKVPSIEQDMRRRDRSSRPMKPRTHRASAGTTLLNIGLSRQHCEILLGLDWTKAEGRIITAAAESADLAGLERAAQWPLCSWNNVPTKWGQRRWGATNHFLSRATVHDSGLVEFRVDKDLPCLLEFSVEHNASVFRQSGWVFSDEHAEGDLTLSSEGLIVLEPFAAELHPSPGPLFEDFS